MNDAEHPFTPEDVQAWVDGEFGGNADPLEAHVESCAECTALVASIRSTSEAMRQWRIESAPSSVPGPAQRPRHAWMMWAAPAAAVLLATALLVWPTRQVPETAGAVTVGLSAGAGPPAAPGAVQAPDPSAVEAPMLVLPMQAQQGQQGGGRVQAQGSQSGGGRQAMVVRTATLALLVTDLEKARSSVDSLVRQVNGFVGQLDTSGARGEARRMTTTLRVPEPRLAETVAALKKLGAVQSESQGGEDVTDQAADLDARLANARETEKRLVTVLQQRTGKVSDVLEVERETARVRESIERMTSQREQLRDRVTYATISLQVSEEAKASLDLGTPSIAGRYRNALVEGTSAATEAALSATLFLIRIAPSLFLALLVFGWPALIVWRRWRVVPQ